MRGECPQPLRPLRPGDLVALVAPAGAVEAGRVEGAARLLRSRGLRVRVRADITARHRYLAGPDGRRAEELLDALTDDAVAAVFLARGGYGTQRLLGALAAGRLGRPKPVVGYSDNTALLNDLRRRFGWPVLHGPHPREERPEELDRVLACLGLGGPAERPRFEGLRPLGSGPAAAVEGEVAGGCLSLLASSAGTPGAVGFGGRIAFLEDTGEPAYRVDRMLHQLAASGAFEGARAVVFGDLRSFGPEADGEHLRHLLEEFASAAPFPVLEGLPCGHTEPNLPLPFGPRAALDPAAGTLTFLDPLVEDPP